MADALRSGRSGSNPVRVQVPPSAPNKKEYFYFVSDKVLLWQVGLEDLEYIARTRPLAGSTIRKVYRICKIQVPPSAPKWNSKVLNRFYIDLYLWYKSYGAKRKQP